ncbi:hypothetical protein CVT26_004216 [Gymnopilus dilepis]|uniref:Uncharacterized protein n=1 Tax=Gymnopilus dilepis TaxID=231916 RepID=A0A409YMR9_9AGAR|nr:hypothetical protein CVT26_004216 [Gymnopilus dilepis]
MASRRRVRTLVAASSSLVFTCRAQLRRIYSTSRLHGSPLQRALRLVKEPLLRQILGTRPSHLQFFGVTASPLPAVADNPLGLHLPDPLPAVAGTTLWGCASPLRSFGASSLPCRQLFGVSPFLSTRLHKPLGSRASHPLPPSPPRNLRGRACPTLSPSQPAPHTITASLPPLAFPGHYVTGSPPPSTHEFLGLRLCDHLSFAACTTRRRRLLPLVTWSPFLRLLLPIQLPRLPAASFAHDPPPSISCLASRSLDVIT